MKYVSSVQPLITCAVLGQCQAPQRIRRNQSPVPLTVLSGLLQLHTKLDPSLCDTQASSEKDGASLKQALFFKGCNGAWWKNKDATLWSWWLCQKKKRRPVLAFRQYIPHHWLFPLFIPRHSLSDTVSSFCSLLQKGALKRSHCLFILKTRWNFQHVKTVLCLQKRFHYNVLLPVYFKRER